MRSRVLVSAGANWLAFAGSLVVGFFMMPFFNHELGRTRYGIWCVIESVLAYVTLLDLGLAVGLVRAVARGNALSDIVTVNRIASATAAVYTAAAGAALLVGLPVGWLLASRLDPSADTFAFVGLMLVNVALSLPLSVFPSVLDGLDRYAEKSAVRLLILVIRTTALIVTLLHTEGLFGLAVVYTVFNMFEHVLFAVLCFRHLPGLRFRPSLVDRETLRSVHGSSRDAFLAMVAGRVTVQTGPIVAGLWLSVEQVAFFAVASRLVEYTKTLLRTITATLTPGVSALDARGDSAGIARLFLTCTRWVLYLVIPVNVGLYVFGRPFLHRWMGPEFVAGSFPSLAILAAGVTVSVAQSVASRILYGLGNLRAFARWTILEAVANLVLTMLLVSPFGLTGVAAAIAIPHLVCCGFIISLTLKKLEISWRDYLRVWLGPMVTGGLVTAVWLLQGDVEPNWPTVGRGIAVGLLPYTLVVTLWECRRTRMKCDPDQHTYTHGDRILREAEPCRTSSSSGPG